MERMPLLFWLAAALPLALALQVRPMQKHMPHGCARCSSTRAPTPMLKQSAAQKEKKKKEKEDDGPYRKSVSLPITEFSQRAMSATREPELQRFWEEEQVYTKLAKENPGAPFVLHDGPPYANGDLHIGHALNKILKDIINRYQLLRGRKVRYVPGWDCHGLPIELKVLQSMNEAERKALTPIELRKKAAAFATQTVSTQRSSFKRYGVWGDWEAPYLTLQPEYEAAQIGVFGDMFLKGHIYRGRKPVHWSPSSRTALAEAELEYPEKHTSRSIYVGFTVTQPAPALQALASDGGPELRVAIWTTTPWTIPANLAVAVNGELEYAVVGHPSLPYRLIVATGLMEALAKRLDELPEGSSLEKLGAFKGTEIEGTKYAHPFYARESQIVIGGDYITTESGTGLVHTAPGHGQDDYLTGLKYGLELLSPVDDAGCFTSEAGEDLKGMPVLAEGNTAVIAKLKAVGALLKEEAYVHKYPYDWRTKQPTIFRATSQWFASVDAFRVDALSAIDKVEWMPAVGQNRITAMTQSRSDWCISRQRTWGVPIPVFYHRDTNEVLLNRQIRQIL
jgi:isoleucyl-tRNA synthetase